MHSIFVEGKDQIFIEQYLEYLFGIESKKIVEVKKSGGWTKLPLITNEFKKTTDAGFKNFVLFDADNEFSTRKLEIEKFKELGIEFSLFLFPNNSSSGDFESLLEQIVNKKHKRLLNCFSKYENCISQYKDEGSNPIYITPARKAKIYSYIDAFPKTRENKEQFKKGNYFFLDKEYWNLDESFIDPLKEFLTEIIFS